MTDTTARPSIEERRLATASTHSHKVRLAIAALNDAIYEALRDGYHAKVRVHNGVALPDETYLGHGQTAVRLTGTIDFDIGGAI